MVSAASLRSDLASSATDTVASAMEGLTKGAETQKNAGADAIAGFARSVKASADELESRSPQIASVVRTSAETVERMSNDLRTRNIDEILGATTDFARRRPVAFLGLGVLVGVVLARIFANAR